MKVKVDNSKKQVIVSAQAFVKANEEDLAIVKKYQAIGYEVVVKEPKRQKADKTSKADIEAALKGDKDGLAKFHELLETKNFFAAKRWYKEYTK